MISNYLSANSTDYTIVFKSTNKMYNFLSWGNILRVLLELLNKFLCYILFHKWLGPLLSLIHVALALDKER